VYYHYDQANLALNNEPLSVFGVQQDFRFPTTYFSLGKLRSQELELERTAYRIEETRLKGAVTSAYHAYLIAHEKERIYLILGDLYEQFAKAANRKFELGESNYLEKITAQSKQKEVEIQVEQTRLATISEYERIRALVQVQDTLIISEQEPYRISIEFPMGPDNPSLQFLDNQLQLSEQQARYEKQNWLPDLSVQYFQGSNALLDDNLYGYQLGIKFPILFGGQASRIRSANLYADQTQVRIQNEKIMLQAKYRSLMNDYNKYKKALDYYENEGEALSDELLKTATSYYTNGEIDFFQYIQSIETAYSLKIDQLEQLRRFNESVVAINFLTF